jgi:tetratricopeptide (TPR) repeat protein
MKRYERDITRAIESARDNVHRAAAYSKRASAYSEKARYSRAFKLIPAEEYERLFGLAIKDHDQAIALDPTSAEAYYSRGRTYYDRAILETVVNGALVGTDSSRKAWFAPAVADSRKRLRKTAAEKFLLEQLILLCRESAWQPSGATCNVLAADQMREIRKLLCPSQLIERCSADG